MLMDILVLILACQYLSAGCKTFSYRGLAGCELGFRHPDAFVSEESYPSHIACAMVCQEDETCVAINICPDESGGFRCQPIATAVDDCGSLTAESDCRYFKKLLDDSCENGGIYNITTEKCDCPLEEITGDRCETFFRDCSEAYDAGLRSEAYTVNVKIKPDSYSEPAFVPCFLDYGGELIVEKRYNQCSTTVSFNRTWQEMKDGFSSGCEHWLGLDLLHAITLQGDYSLDVVVNIGGSAISYRYSQFTIDSEANGYKLDYGTTMSISGGGNGFEYGGATQSIKGQEFATFDNPDTSGCAVASGASWWFGTACTDVNLHTAFEDLVSPPPFARWPDDADVLHTAERISLRLKRT